MLVDSYILPQWLANPRSFSGLMALYEANFIKLNQLIAGLQECTGQHLSQSDSDHNLHLSVEGRTKYTCELRLTYLFDEAKHPRDDVGPVADPDLITRVFLDARMADVQSWINLSRHEMLRSLHDRYRREIDRRWARNMMLSKWLDYLLDNRHFFPVKQGFRGWSFDQTVDSIKV
ncbi:MAG: hypothetical protein CL799_06960 [Chromatiales bacterium]|jgi:uncharacterized protein YqiB (DUF1249 family)|nr:hypothetical protein [Chromatiales bacterium]HJP05674.1 DUF1249 domain-containing protein [Gammaproteobacteria bacterium]